MKAESIWLLELIGNGKRAFYVPVYQRNYDWKKAECTKLFQDIESLCADQSRISHFLGTIVCMETGFSSTFRSFTLIDGQQRITSIMLLLKALYDAMEDGDTRDDIMDSYLINPRVRDEKDKIKLRLMNEDAQNFKNLIEGQEESIGNTRVAGNFRLFKGLIAESPFTPMQIFEGIQRLQIVYIALEEGKENPQLVFESLNSTGRDLTQSDLIRNFLLMGLSPDQQEKVYFGYWLPLEKMMPESRMSNFIRDYLTLKTSSFTKLGDIYTSFKTYYYSAGIQDVELFLKELKNYGNYYNWFWSCESPYAKVNILLDRFGRLQLTTVYPFLLKLFYECFALQNITKEELCLSLGVLLSYTVRRALCDMPTNALNKVFMTMIKDVENSSRETMHEKIEDVLLSKTGRSRFPSDRDLEKTLTERDFYHFQYAKFILEEIENAESKETVDFSDLTIEHIMPQTLSPQWEIDLGRKGDWVHEHYLHVLGNLTLTAYNSELSNEVFAVKKGVFEESNVKITRELSYFENWGEQEIQQRTEELITKIKKIWKYPIIIVSKEKDDETDIFFTDDMEVTGRQPISVDFIGTVYSVFTWRGLLKTICGQLLEYDESSFRDLVNHPDFNGSRRRKFLAFSSDGMTSAIKLEEGLFVEGNLSAKDILNYVRLILAKFDGMLENCSYRLKPEVIK